MNNLTARQFETFGPGKYADGDNLHLHVSPTGQRRFIYSPRVGTKRPEYGFKADTLKAARLERDRLKGLIAQGIDPRSGKEIDAKPDGHTFGKVIATYIGERRSQWKPRTIEEWERTATIACASIANKPLDDITVQDIKALLLPIFAKSPDKARRTKEKINAVYGYAQDHELCDRDRRSPAEGKTLIPAVGQTDKHHAALPYNETPEFIATIRAIPRLSTRVLEFIILTATRAGEAAGAKWDEIDMQNATWNIPSDRMKMNKPHTVPLSPRAIQILQDMKDARPTDSSNPFVFPGRDGTSHITVETLYKTVTETLGMKLTVHGFRSTFRDWAGDATQYPREIAEHALAHAVGGVEGAYRRGSALEKRRQMMNDWADYCGSSTNPSRLRSA